MNSQRQSILPAGLTKILYLQGLISFGIRERERGGGRQTDRQRQTDTGRQTDRDRQTGRKGERGGWESGGGGYYSILISTYYGISE